jgi:hypothetical protein
MSLSLKSSISVTEYKMSLISSRETQNRQRIRMLAFNYDSLTDCDDCCNGFLLLVLNRPVHIDCHCYLSILRAAPWFSLFS